MSKPTRLDCLRFLADHISETDIVVPALGETEALWHALSGGRPGNFYIRNGMSMPTSVGLGLAVAQPSRHVWVLEGDGGMLMNLGSLSTIAAQGPRNLRIIIFVNRQYQASGGQRLSASVDFELLARGSGLQHVASVHAASDLAKGLDVLAASSGPA
ncbi:MAG: thiamine pyrophosphate-dependent enzyme, partial [Dehalococcoidia bacterium]